MGVCFLYDMMPIPSELGLIYLGAYYVCFEFKFGYTSARNYDK